MSKKIFIKNKFFTSLSYLVITCLLAGSYPPVSLPYTILLKAKHDELICESITLHNHELVQIRQNIFSHTRIWSTVSWNQKPVRYQWAMVTPLLVHHLVLCAYRMFSSMFIQLLFGLASKSTFRARVRPLPSMVHLNLIIIINNINNNYNYNFNLI